jgi:hypothetical protein
MDIEELKLVLETVQGIANGATSVAIWYFVLTYGLSFLSKVMCAGVGIYIVHRIASTVLAVNEDEALLKELRSALIADSYGGMSTGERNLIRKRFYELQAKHGNS